MTAALDVGVLVVEPTCETAHYDLGRAGTVDLPLYYITKTEELEHLDLWLATQKRFLIDTETSGLDPLSDHIATIQFGMPVGPDPRLYVVDVRCVDRDRLVALLAAYLPKRGIKKLGMNVSFECKFITAEFDVPLRDVECIQIAEQVIRTGLFGAEEATDDEERTQRRSRAAYSQTSMARLCRFYLGIELDKDKTLRTSFYSTPPGTHNHRQRTYAAGDCVYPLYVAKYQRQELDDRDLYATARVEWEIIPVIAEAELRGMYIDQAEWRVLWQEAVTKLDETQRKLDQLILGARVQGTLFDESLEAQPSGPQTHPEVRPLYLGGKKPVDLNYGSSDHVKWLIKQYCNAIAWPVEVITDWATFVKRKKQEGRTWLVKHPDKKPEDVPEWVLPEDRYCVLLKAERKNLVIAKCLGQLPRDLADLLADYSIYRKRASTYGIKFLADNVRSDTGRIHVQFHQLITSTGRVSTEPNSQNIPGDKRYRACFKPAPGKKFVISDYSQVEPRITALVTQDPVYMNTFLTKDDIYLAVAEGQLGERPDKHTEEGGLQRQRFKQMVLSLAYLMGKGEFRRRMILALHKEIMAGKVEPPTFREISTAHDGFFQVHEAIRKHQLWCVEQADPKVSQRKLWDSMLQAPVTWIEAPCGRKRFFPPDAKPHGDATNVEPQAGSATMLKAAMGLIQKEIDQRGWLKKAGLVNMVHDELVYEVDEDIAHDFAVVQKECMERAGNFYSPGIPIIAEWPEGSRGVVSYWSKKSTGDEE
jgi:DNA polymerase I-like protein with 3'-5' exonuclease and polymerase domains